MPETLSSFNSSAVITGEFSYYVLDGAVLWGVIEDETTVEQEMEIHHLIGRGRKADFGDFLGAVGSLRVQLRDKQESGGPSARAQREWLTSLKEQKLTVFLETPFGDVYNVACGNISFSRLAGVGEGRDFGSATIPFTQVVDE